METLDIEEFELNELREVAFKILHFAGGVKIWLFKGGMGAGKTTMIRQVCTCLGVTDNVSSPTYALVNEYEGAAKEIIYHFDFYRIKHEAEALDIGVDEYFASGHLCLVEWPSQIPSLWPDKYMEVEIILVGENTRRVVLKKHV